MNYLAKENRLPPHDIAAEESVIGSLLLDGDAIKYVGRLTADDFYHEPLGTMFAVCIVLKDRKESINQITVAQELDRQGKLEDSGGVAYLSYLISVIPTSLDIDSYAGIVQRLSVSRKQVQLGQKITEQAYQANPDTNQALENVTALINQFQKENSQYDKLITPRDSADLVMKIMNDYTNPQTETLISGFRDLDNLTGGLHPAELTIAASRPGMGKTQLILDMIEHSERQGKTVLFVSGEMAMQQILERKVARLLGKSILQIRRGQITDEEKGRIADLASRMAESNTYSLPEGVSTQEVRKYASKLKERVGLDLVAVDYIQIMSDCFGDKETQNIRVGKASKNLKSLANELKVPVLAASQLSRAVEYRLDSIPTLADLRDSGAIEQDADVVLLLHRYLGKDATDDEGDNDPSILRIKMAKNRQLGPAKSIPLKWVEQLRRYTDYTPNTDLQPVE